MPLRRLALVAAGLPLALSLAACGSDDGAGAAGDGDPGSSGAVIDPAATPTLSSGAAGADEQSKVAGAVEAVTTIAPALESAVRSETYPMSLDEARERIEAAGLTPAAPLVVGGYLYHPESVEFTLCIEDSTTGAYATYDTGPMAPGAAAPSGGCQTADLSPR
ncbi:hypothetical protein [Nocardioides sp.]|uniref:hypothetical protein n=1 Tax=Nocardioides sp. TaxID=35761 RepID=UPI0035168776